MEIPAKHHLEYYASQFDTVELNGVFYRTPTPESVRRWRDQTGRHFVFAWKASKFITHWKRLTENSINSLQLLDERLSILGDKTGPILFQLPPDFAADAGRLTSFLTLLPERRQYSFEFRHPSCVIVVRDAICSSSDEGHEMLMRLYHTRYYRADRDRERRSRPRPMGMIDPSLPDRRHSRGGQMWINGPSLP